MHNKQLIETGVHFLQGVDPDTIQNMEIERYEHDDGSISYSVTLTTPPTNTAAKSGPAPAPVYVPRAEPEPGSMRDD